MCLILVICLLWCWAHLVRGGFRGFVSPAKYPAGSGACLNAFLPFSTIYRESIAVDMLCVSQGQKHLEAEQKALTSRPDVFHEALEILVAQ